MSRNDKLILWGAVAVMIAVGGLFLWQVSQIPAIDPRIAALKVEHEKLMNGPRHMPGPDPIPAYHLGFLDVIPEPRLPQPQADLFRTRLVEVPMTIAHRTTEVMVLPFASLGVVRSDLDGTTLAWTVQDAPQEKLKDWQKQKPAKPAGFIIERRCGDSEPVLVMKLGPEARSYTDLSTEPRKTYRYRVSVTGKETIRTSYPAQLEPVTKALAWSAETRTPSDTRARLVGGDKSNAFLRMETYDRTAKKWTAGKVTMAAPGQKVGGSGWTLKGLRFDNFTLVADVTDDEGVDRVLTTRN
jgi:hypothetical protein